MYTVSIFHKGLSGRPESTYCSIYIYIIIFPFTNITLMTFQGFKFKKTTIVYKNIKCEVKFINRKFVLNCYIIVQSSC